VAAVLFAEGTGRLAKAPFEAAGEIKLVTKTQQFGDLADGVTALVKERDGPVGAGIELKFTGGDAHRLAKFFAETFVGEPKMFRDGGGIGDGDGLLVQRAQKESHRTSHSLEYSAQRHLRAAAVGSIE